MNSCLKRGQVTVLALLLGLLGLTLGLSVASRSLSDLRQVSYVDSGTRAYAAAEAALQRAIYGYTQLGQAANCQTQTVTPVPAGFTGGTLQYTICPSAQTFASQTSLAKDDVFQVTVPTGNPDGLTAVDVLWNSNLASMEVISIDTSFNVRRSLIRGQSATQPSNSSQTATATSCNTSPTCTTAGMTSCAANITFTNPSVLRVKPIIGSGGPTSVNVVVCGRNASGATALSTQTITITATATSADGTVKRVQAIRTPPQLPSVFDNVVFSSSGITKN